MLTEREVFKAAFLSHCADQGMDMVETATAVKEAQTKLSALSDLITTPVNTMWDGVKSMGGLAKNVGIIGALGLPLAAGAGIGYGAAALTDVNDEDVEETKLKELIDEHRRLAQRARMNAAASQAKQQNTRRGRPLI